MASSVTEFPPYDAVLASMRTEALRAWQDAVDLARRGAIAHAYSRCEGALIIQSDPRLRDLAGYLSFALGNVAQASYWWSEWPPIARQTVDTFNVALQKARDGHIDEAEILLGRLALPYAPAWRLREACLRELGRKSAAETLSHQVGMLLGSEALPVENTVDAAPSSRERLSSIGSSLFFRRGVFGVASIAATAAALLLLPRVTREGEKSEMPQPFVTPTGSLVSSGPDHLVELAFWRGDASVVEAAAGGLDSLGSEARYAMQEVPYDLRKRSSLAWYREGRDALARGETQGARTVLTAAVAAVGVRDTVYWIDDALALLLESLPDSARTYRVHLAKLLAEHQPKSLFLARGSIRELVLSEVRGP